MTSAPFTSAKRLRELLKDRKRLVVCPGVFDGLTARIALSKGFDALYMVRPISPFQCPTWR
jgi:2-methylisocitrate lyase-like PEP mutase family enzyme